MLDKVREWSFLSNEKVPQAVAGSIQVVDWLPSDPTAPAAPVSTDGVVRPQAIRSL